MFQAQNREIAYLKSVAVSFKIIMTTSVTRSFFTKQYQTCKTKTTAYKTKTKTVFWSQTGLVLRPTVSDHITGLLSSVIMGLSRAVSEINANFPIHVFNDPVDGLTGGILQCY